ncbi:MAG: hypothetical protein Q4A74_03440 [Cardiobacteriaceae bacterium]|nr:hypothetical protein [Cardiobacteriaceae bacterium]
MTTSRIIDGILAFLLCLPPLLLLCFGVPEDGSLLLPYAAAVLFVLLVVSLCLRPQVYFLSGMMLGAAVLQVLFILLVHAQGGLWLMAYMGVVSGWVAALFVQGKVVRRWLPFVCGLGLPLVVALFPFGSLIVRVVWQV